VSRDCVEANYRDCLTALLALLRQVFQPTAQPTFPAALPDFRVLWQSPRSCKSFETYRAGAVTAEVAGSSPVVPAIILKNLVVSGGIQKDAKRTHFCVQFASRMPERKPISEIPIDASGRSPKLWFGIEYQRHDRRLRRMLGWCDCLRVDIQS
jgi:hypothetical protein